MATFLTSIGFGGYALAAVLLSETVLSTETHVPLGWAVSLTFGVAGIVWWMGGKFAKIDSQLREHTKILKRLPCTKQGCDMEQETE